MVTTRKRTSTQDSTKARSTKADKTRTAAPAVEFEIDDDLCGADHDQIRPLNLPFANIINDDPAGILIPLEQLEKSGWYNIPDEDNLDTARIGGSKLVGILLTEARMRILAVTPEYIRYKNDDELGELSKAFIGLYEDYRHELDKKTMDVCSDHLLLFVDENNQPLHEIPIVVRFRNVALWSFRDIREKWGRALEQAVFKCTNKSISKKPKSDRWRANGILEVVFSAEDEGQGKNTSLCCKTVSYTKPTTANIHELFTGTGAIKQGVTELLDATTGFADTVTTVPALPGESHAAEVLEPEFTSRKSKKTLRSAAVKDFDDDEEFFDADDGEFDVSDELDEDDE